jgi:hypothetical protein
MTAQQERLPARPRRHMPSLRKIVDHWRETGTFDVEDHPHCFACREQAPADNWTDARGWLERAHLIDRYLGGLDGPQNLVPLCGVCHGWQPIFEPGAEAIAWVLAGGYRGEIARLYALLSGVT